uniref:Uncharacterized protein n=1 Tax=Anguilla anguilla TaxID=7936 RepID=A0A0E9QXA9_ANGAN
MFGFHLSFTPSAQTKHPPNKNLETTTGWAVLKL